MSLELCILASGSAGNAAIIRSPAGVLLIDAGIGPRTLESRLDGTGVRLTDIGALCLTHLDGDHFSPSWAPTLRRLNIPIYCHAKKVEALAYYSPDLVPLLRPFTDEAFSPIVGLRCNPIYFAHDRLGSHGFVLDGFGYRIGYATDLGHVPSHFFHHFRDLDCIALEANYDPRMQAASSRPYFLKRRITGGRGHLSNLQALSPFANYSIAPTTCRITSSCCIAVRNAIARTWFEICSAAISGSQRASPWLINASAHLGLVDILASHTRASN